MLVVVIVRLVVWVLLVTLVGCLVVLLIVVSILVAVVGCSRWVLVGLVVLERGLHGPLELHLFGHLASVLESLQDLLADFVIFVHNIGRVNGKGVVLLRS